MYVVFFILILVLILIALPFYFKLNIKYNIKKNTGQIKIYLFKILIMHFSIKYEAKKMILYNIKTSKSINLDKKQVAFINEFRKQIFKRIYLSNIYLSFKLGLKSNPAIIAILIAFIKSTLNVIFSRVSYLKPTSDLKYKLATYYTKNMGIINSEIKCAISLINLFFAVVKAKINTNKKYER